MKHICWVTYYMQWNVASALLHSVTIFFSGKGFVVTYTLQQSLIGKKILFVGLDPIFDVGAPWKISL